MRKQLLHILTIGVLAASLASASIITFTVGQQDYNDGDTPTTADFLTAGSGEPAPFNGAFIGADNSVGPNFSASWSIPYTGLSTISGVTFRFGIYDHDSAAAGNQVASFTINGTDYTAALNTAFETNAKGNRGVGVYSLTLPTATITPVPDGSVAFVLNLTGPGLGLTGTTTFNGAALDFAEIQIDNGGTPPPVGNVPEPSTLALAAAGLGTLALRRLKTRR